MGKRRGLIGLASGISLALVGHATAKPATSKDLAGRTICYNNGEKATYFRGGKYESSKIGNGTWSATSAGIQISAEHFAGLIDFELQPDGTLSLPAYVMTGKDCK